MEVRLYNPYLNVWINSDQIVYLVSSSLISKFFFYVVTFFARLALLLQIIHWRMLMSTLMSFWLKITHVISPYRELKKGMWNVMWASCSWCVCVCMLILFTFWGFLVDLFAPYWKLSGGLTSYCHTTNIESL